MRQIRDKISGKLKDDRRSNSKRSLNASLGNAQEGVDGEGAGANDGRGGVISVRNEEGGNTAGAGTSINNEANNNDDNSENDNEDN